MDNLRGHFPELGGSDDDAYDRDYGEDDIGSEPPPASIGQDERRMQVRAYNYWASLLDNRNFPAIEDLEPEDLPDFGPYSVLLDFTSGIENPAVAYLGDKLAEECGGGDIERLNDVPSRSLLSRITDHYMQILANQAPIGFEAEFVNQRSATILYRGILLPFSSDDETIDFIYGVINWKELADQRTTDELLLEIEQALGETLDPPLAVRGDEEITEWADGPADAEGILDLLPEAELDDDFEDELDPGFGGGFDAGFEPGIAADSAWPSEEHGDDAEDLDEDEADAPLAGGTATLLSIAALAPGQPAKRPVNLSALNLDLPNGESAEPVPFVPEAAHEGFAPQFEDTQFDDAALDDAQDMELADWLASARDLALAARGNEERSRLALYAAIGRAHDFSLAAAAAPHEFTELVAEAGLSVQERAPLTPLVKLVFGVDYDKTRITEYATALGHAQRLGLGRGELAGYLHRAEGGLKGVVATERRLRREESGKAAPPRETPRAAIARKLRKLEPLPFDAVPAEGSEFTLLVARRMPDGTLALLGEVGDDVGLLEKAARHLLD